MTGGRYPNEVACIESIRDFYDCVGPYTLARQIKQREVTSNHPYFNNVVEHRSVYSILSVIRRYDAKQKRAKQAA